MALDSAGFGDDQNALERFADSIGVSVWTLDHIKRGKAKTVTGGVIARVRLGYLNYCRQKAKHLLSEIKLEKAINPDGDLEVLDRKMSALVGEIEEKRKAQWARLKSSKRT